jgi:hypothetical protein
VPKGGLFFFLCCVVLCWSSCLSSRFQRMNLQISLFQIEKENQYVPLEVSVQMPWWWWLLALVLVDYDIKQFPSL